MACLFSCGLPDVQVLACFPNLFIPTGLQHVPLRGLGKVRVNSLSCMATCCKLKLLMSINENGNGNGSDDVIVMVIVINHAIPHTQLKNIVM